MRICWTEAEAYPVLWVRAEKDGDDDDEVVDVPADLVRAFQEAEDQYAKAMRALREAIKREAGY